MKFAFIIFILAISASAHDSHQTTAIEKTPFALLLDEHLAQICVPYHMNIKYLFSDITINPYPGTIHLHVSNATEYDLPCITYENCLFDIGYDHKLLLQRTHSESELSQDC